MTSKPKKQYTYGMLSDEVANCYNSATTQMTMKIMVDTNKHVLEAIQKYLYQIVVDNGWNTTFAADDLGMNSTQPRIYRTQLMRLIFPAPPEPYESIWVPANVKFYADLVGVEPHAFDLTSLQQQVDKGGAELHALMHYDTTFHNLPYLLHHYPLLSLLMPDHVLTKYRKTFSRRPANPYVSLSTSTLILMIIQAQSLGVLDAK